MRRRVTSRITLLIPFVVGFFALLSGVLMYSLTINSYKEIIKKEAVDEITIDITQLQNLLYVSLTEADFAAARLNLSITGMDPAIQTLLLADEKNMVMIATRYNLEKSDARAVPGYDAAVAERVIKTNLPAILEEGQSLIRGYYPAILELGLRKGSSYKRVGILYVEATFAPKLAVVKREAAVGALIFGGFTAFSAILVALLLHFRVSLRLKKLEKAANELAGGNLEATSSVTGADELAAVANAFDTMVRGIREQIQRREQVEERLRENLQALEKTSIKLARSNQELKQYAFIASHDLQEPLRTIISFNQLLQKKYAHTLADEDRKYAEFIISASRRMKQLVTDLLAYSQTDNEEVVKNDVDLNGLMKHVMANLREPIRKTGAKITVDPLPTVWCSGSQIEAVLQNMVSNAIKYRSGLPPVIHVSAELEGDFWRITVRDNGIGIDPQFFDRIFVIFQRLHGRDEFDGGTGVGLAICKKLVERHGGRIKVESGPGEGSSFHFTLPANKESGHGNV